MVTLPRDSVEDQKRLTEDIKSICGRIARNLLMNTSDPYILCESYIKAHKTMRKKSIRLLREAGVIGYGRMHPTSRNELEYDFTDLFWQHSKDYWEVFTPPAEPEDITNYLKKRETSEFSIGEFTLLDVGYTEVSYLNAGQAIYVYWNLKDFDLKVREAKERLGDDDIEEFFGVYPKVNLIQRQKAIMKMILKKYSEIDFKAYMENRFGDCFEHQTEVLKKPENNEDPYFERGVHFSFEIRNFMKFPETFGSPDKCFHSNKGYVKEYRDMLEKISYEYNRLSALITKVNLVGGCKQVGKDYIEECLKEIVSKAPLLINGDEGEKSVLQYILDNRDLFKYDFIYGERVSV